MTLLKASSFFLAILALEGCVETQIDFAAEVVCRQSDDDTLCPKLSHLNTELDAELTSSLSAKLGYDFAQSRKATWYDSLDLNHLNLPPQRSWLANYELTYTLPANRRWSLSIEDSAGVTLLPNASYLAFAGNLQDTGWNQSVSRLSFHNEDVFLGDLIVGLGEGERLEADDGDMYYAARFRWYAQRVLALQLAYSQDQNSLPKDAIWWLPNREDAHKGFQNQRMAVSLLLNGKWSSARGLEASIGWQKNSTDAARNDSLAAPLDYALDPTEILSQDLGGFGKTKKEAWLASASYRILAEYIIAVHTGQFEATLDSPSLQACGSIDRYGNCYDLGSKTRSFSIKEWTYGLGKIDKDAWSFLLEAHEERYDRLYQNFHFLNGHNPRQKSMRLVQARINWNW